MVPVSQSGLTLPDARRLLKLESGLLFANPIPREHSLPKSEIDGAIEQAVREAAEKGYFGSQWRFT